MGPSIKMQKIRKTHSASKLTSWKLKETQMRGIHIFVKHKRKIEHISKFTS